MAVSLHGAGLAHARALIASGKVNQSDSWSFSAEDGNALLGNPPDWAAYGRWFFGHDPASNPETKDAWLYPFGKNGQVYRSALRAIASRAAQQNESAISNAASALIADLDAKSVTPQHAYSVLHIKALHEDQRILEGVASTPTPDRQGDVMDPLGASFALPMPFLWQHGKDPFVGGTAVGHVIAASPNADGIPVRIQMAQADRPGRLKDILDFAWDAIRQNLVRGLSIGWRPTAFPERMPKTGFVKYPKWEFFEVSAVTIPANVDTNIFSIKSADAPFLAVSGSQAGPSRALSGASDVSRDSSRQDNRMAKYHEKISALLAEKQPKAVRMSELMQPVVDGEADNLTADEQKEYDELRTQVSSFDQRIKNFEALESSEAKAALPVIAPSGPVRKETNLNAKAVEQPKGMGFTRYAIAMCRARGNLVQAASIAKQWRDSTPEVEIVLKTAVDAGTTTDMSWAGNLVQYQVMASEFVEFLRAMTIIGRIPNLRRVPFNIKLPVQTAGTQGAWVGQGTPKPVGKLATDTITLLWAKAAGIVVLTDELVRFSNPSAEALVRNDLGAGISEFLDQQFVDPNVTEDPNVSPASITSGAPNNAASGATAEDLRADYKAALVSFRSEKINPVGSVFIMQPDQAEAIGLMLNPLGQPEFPSISGEGGTLFSKTVITSESVPDGIIILAKPSEILLADDGQVTIDVSNQASLQMSDTPSPGEQALYSLWQNNAVGIRAERYINWKVRRANAVYYITGANYGGGS